MAEKFPRDSFRVKTEAFELEAYTVVNLCRISDAVRTRDAKEQYSQNGHPFIFPHGAFIPSRLDPAPPPLLRLEAGKRR